MRAKQRGFSMVELMISMAVLLLVVGSVLQLLSQSQQRYVTSSSVEDAASMVRDTMDQMIREIRLAGYPPIGSYPCPPPPGATYGACMTETNSGYVAGGIMAGGDYAIQFESDTDNTGSVNVIDYELQVPPGPVFGVGDCAGLTVNNDLTTPTLMRSSVVKNADGSVPAPEFFPFLEFVRNCEIAEPIFIFCPAPGGAGGAPAECPTMDSYVSSSLAPPRNTRVVLLNLQADTAVRDPQTGQFQNIQQFGVAERVNPDR